jgi:hypothetical protein
METSNQVVTKRKSKKKLYIREKVEYKEKCPYGSLRRRLCKNQDCKRCYNRSFASDIKASSRWLKEKNNGIEPRDVFKNTSTKYWFKCRECGHDFKRSLSDVSASGWCYFCGGKRLCEDKDCVVCFNRSFASHPKAGCWLKEKNNNLEPRDVFRKTKTKYWFKCDKCEHDFCTFLVDLDGKWCYFCSSKKLCKKEDCITCYNKSLASNIKASSCWLKEKNNNLDPRDVFKNSSLKFWFKCPECSTEHNNCPYDLRYGIRCSICTNKTERLFMAIISKIFPELKYQPKFDFCINKETNRKLPYDFLIESKKCIVEIDGRQHFRQIKNWRTPELQKDIDLYKMKRSIDNGYSVIRILQEDIFEDKNNWKELFLQELERHPLDTKECVLIGNDTDYHLHFLEIYSEEDMENYKEL